MANVAMIGRWLYLYSSTSNWGQQVEIGVSGWDNKQSPSVGMHAISREVDRFEEPS